MQEEQTIKWYIAREVIHLAYDYNNSNEATQWDFISNIEDKDLIELYYYCALQKYTKTPMIEYKLSWNQINQLIKLECEYRSITYD